jgi:integrase
MGKRETYRDLVMIGHVRTDRKCPKCKGKFQKVKDRLVCKKCLTEPARFFIDLPYKGERFKIWWDENGQALDSYERADRLLNHIRWEVDHFRFKPEKYRQAKSESFYFEVYAKSWLKEQEIRHKSNEIAFSTLYQRRMIVRKYLVPYFGRTDIRHIGTRSIKDFNLHLAELKVKGNKTMSPKYREGVIGVIRQIFFDGLRSGDLNRIHVPVFPQIDVPDAYFDFLTEDEQDENLKKIPMYDRPIFHFILWYGVRPSEARALMRDCILGNFDEVVIRRTFSRNNRLRDNPKENKWRVIPLEKETKAILKKLPISITGFIFINKWGRRYSQSYLNDTWNKACKDAGYRYIPLKNASRHSLGTKLAQEGLGENIIATVLGHSDTKTTKKYTRYTADSLKPFFKRRNVKKASVRRLSVTNKLKKPGT